MQSIHGDHKTFLTIDVSLYTSVMQSLLIKYLLMGILFDYDNVEDSWTSHPSDIIFSGFDVAKTGDARIGFVGKWCSTLLYSAKYKPHVKVNTSPKHAFRHIQYYILTSCLY